MRLVCLGVTVLLALVAPAFADACRLCEQAEAAPGLGHCAECARPTVSPSYPLCSKCSKQLAQCERCRADLTETAPAATQPAIVTTKDGRYSAGRWEYVLEIKNPGTRSEGVHGALLFDGKPLPAPAHLNDYYQTPLGKIYWAGQPAVLYGPHGWMPQPRPADPSGSRLPHPAGLVRATVYFQLISDGAHDARIPAPKEPWLLAEAKKLGIKDPRIQLGWLAATAQPIVLHQSRHFGTAEVQFAPTPGNQPLTLAITGDRPETIQLPRRDGATRLVKYDLATSVGTLQLNLACRVEVTFGKTAPSSDSRPPSSDSRRSSAGTRESSAEARR